MIKYNASDVIKKAKQLADLENSDFISWNESLTLLNDAYQNIYQKSINKGNNDFVKVITTDDKVITMPNDFYQLKALTLKQDRFTTPIMRRPQNGSFRDLSYDIYNNTIQINGYSSGTIILEYFPTPVTLTLPSEDVTIDLPIGSDETLIGAYKNVYFVKRTDKEENPLKPLYNKTYIVAINRDTGEEAKVATQSIWGDDYSVSETILFSIGDYVLFTGTNHDFVNTSNGLVKKEYKCIFRLNIVDFSVEVQDRENTYGYLTYGFSFYDDTDCMISAETYLGETRITSATIYGKHYDLRKNNILVPEKPFIIILSKDMKHTFSIDSENLYKYIDGEKVSKDMMHVMGDSVYLKDLNTNYCTLLDLNTKKEIALVAPSKKPIWGTVGFNKDTGYGYYYFLGKNKIVIHSFLEDTELNFPNNMFFNYLAYLLALSFKVKQGSDISAFMPLLENAENTFYDSLTKDDWSFTRITNVY
jgi:hypothetical protein